VVTLVYIRWYYTLCLSIYTASLPLLSALSAVMWLWEPWLPCLAPPPNLFSYVCCTKGDFCSVRYRVAGRVPVTGRQACLPGIPDTGQNERCTTGCPVDFLFTVFFICTDKGLSSVFLLFCFCVCLSRSRRYTVHRDRDRDRDRDILVRMYQHTTEHTGCPGTTGQPECPVYRDSGKPNPGTRYLTLDFCLNRAGGMIVDYCTT
jgi:hypothetical protein